MKRQIEALKNTLKDNECVFISSYPNIFYYSGFSSNDAYLIISHNENIIITDSRYTVQAKEECPDFSLINITEGFEKIFKNLSSSVILYEEKDMSVGFYINLKKQALNKTFISSSDKISSFREKKDAFEIKKIQEAEHLGDEAFSYILNFIKPGMNEIEIASEIEYFMRKNGASRLSFETIVASGVRSSMPHGTATEKTIQKGELLTLDFGCVLDGYCSDMTRTVGIGYISEKEREIYDIVLKAQETALSGMQIDMKCSDIDKLARDVISGFGYGANFGHSLGHSVGIEIHEAPNFSAKSEAKLQNGHVITVEPGIYIESLGGVRIEDVIAVLDDNIINLTKSPKELIIL